MIKTKGIASQIVRLTQEIVGLKQENKRLREVLEEIEWEGSAYVAYEYVAGCPCCGGARSLGHRDNCALNLALNQQPGTLTVKKA